MAKPRGGDSAWEKDPTEHRLPASAPTLMGIVDQCGVATARQAALLWPEPITERRTQQLFAALRSCGLVRANRVPIKYAPSNAHVLDDEQARRHGRGETNLLQPETLFTLTDPAGISYVAARREESAARVRKAYHLSYQDGKREHAYLGTEVYALHAGALKERPSTLVLVRLEKEGGIGRVQLPEAEGLQARTHEPDGYMQLLDLEDSDAGGGSPTTVFMEFDTGSQDQVDKIARKAESYARWYLAGGSPTCDIDVSDHPSVLFVSPTPKRARTVLRFIRLGAEDRTKSPHLRTLHRLRKRSGFQDGMLDLFCATSLKLLRERGAWGPAYEYLSDHTPGPLLF